MDIDILLKNFHKRASVILGCPARVKVAFEEREGLPSIMYHCSAPDSWMDKDAPVGTGFTVSSSLADLKSQVDKLNAEKVGKFEEVK